MIRNRIASGEFAPASRVVRDEPRASQAQSHTLETWLQTEVAAAYDEAKADPFAFATGNEVRTKLMALRKRAAKKRP